MAGEIGNTINFTGEGNPFLRNLEESCGGQMLIRRAQERWGAQDNFLLRKLTGDYADKVTVEDIVAAANSGDAFAVRLAGRRPPCWLWGCSTWSISITQGRRHRRAALRDGGYRAGAHKEDSAPASPRADLSPTEGGTHGFGYRASLVGAAEAAFHVIFTSPIGDPHGHKYCSASGLE
jgi:hypothetical protein